MSKHQIHYDQLAREDLRWRILSTMEAGRPNSVSEDLIFRIAKDVGLDITLRDIRNEMTWLEDQNLIQLTHRGKLWMGRILSTGVNVVEYNVDAPVGIARPHRL